MNISQARALPGDRLFFAGQRVRALRRTLSLSQKDLATRLGISVSYLSQIESGDRPLTKTVLTALSSQFAQHWSRLDPDDEDELFTRLLEAFNDPRAPGPIIDGPGAHEIIRRHPHVAERVITLHAAFKRSQEQVRVLDDRVDAQSSAMERMPWEEVRDWFHLQQNYVDPIDRDAERLAADLAGDDAPARIRARLSERFGIAVEMAATGGTLLYDFDPARRVLRIDPGQSAESATFSLARQLCLLELGELIDAIARTVPSGATRDLLAAGLANYAAGALLMPYADFREAARACRHDIDVLRQQFGGSFEQTCHRLSTLQRPGQEGIPVFFCRVDMAGNITKRHSATPLQFARFGGACPLWIVHEAVAIPDRILVQLAETPDGGRYVSMAKGLVKPSGSYTRMPRRYAVALGCEERHAADFVYADGLWAGGAATPIGTSCRICPRRDCEQRAFPPAATQIAIDPYRRGAIPYAIR